MWIGLVLAAVFLHQTVTMMSFKDQCVITHNKFRAIHQAPPVNWSTELVAKAERWANYLARENKAQHESDSVITDNLYLTSGRPNQSCTEAVEAFYSEIADYDYNKPLANWAKTGHFTQVVWKSTREIVAAQAIRNDSKLIVVIKYNPGGNIMIESYYKANVLPPSGEPATKCACAFLTLMSAVISVLFYGF